MSTVILRPQQIAPAFLTPFCSRYNCQTQEKDLYVGVPAIIGRKGVEKIIEIELNSDEKKEFAKSIASVKDLLNLL